MKLAINIALTIGWACLGATFYHAWIAIHGQTIMSDALFILLWLSPIAILIPEPSTMEHGS
ncbi:MAG: hypothetical protein CMF19_03945 [Idiomarinaceae bacterium]|nr:hypothetical protein [Idiomarinaceae bacterium]